LVAILLIAVVVAAGAGYWLLAPKIANEATSAAQRTSLLTPLERIQTSTEWTVLGSPTTGPWATTQTLWINVSASQPVSYYLGLLESNGTQPYVQLARELRKLPDLTNATAVSSIVFLALNATNPEVKEAFELMIKGGTPDPRDFTYTVPQYNTELQVLYWLACQNEFKKDDILALAIAMGNGVWITMGDNQVSDVVRNDTGDLLRFFRDVDEFQRRMGWVGLEDYSLEAKLLLVWTGDDALKVGHGPHTEVGAEAPHSIFEYTTHRVDRKTYRWNNVDPSTLRKMQDVMMERQWVAPTVRETYERVEEFFLPSPHWYYTASPERRGKLVTVDGEQITPYVIHNARFLFDYFIQTGMGFGVCDDQATLVSAFLKSVGISTSFVYKLWKGTPFGDAGHTFNVYYDSISATWTANDWQLSTPGGSRMNITIDFYMFVPPVKQGGYLQYVKERFYGMMMGAAYYTMNNIPNMTIYSMFRQGINSASMKQWLLYS
jgi:hypothetical protein